MKPIKHTVGLSQAFVILLVAWFFVAPEYAYAVDYQGIGFIQPDGKVSYSRGISDNGQYVIGHAFQPSQVAYYWHDGALTPIAPVSGQSVSLANDVSADGAVIVGYNGNSGSAIPFVFQSGAATILNHLPGYAYGRAEAISADGSIIVGYSSGNANGSQQAFRWQDGTVTGLGNLGGVSSITNQPLSRAYGISSNGDIIVGVSASLNGTEAFKWENGEMNGLGDLSGGDFKSYAFSSSNDGSVIAGYATDSTGDVPVIWKDNQIIALGDLPGGGTEGRAFAVSADGTIVVGTSESDRGEEAFIWDEINGMRRIEDVLIDLGIDTTGYTIASALDITADGTAIVGARFNGVYSSGYAEGYIAIIPEPSSILALTTLLLLQYRIRKRGRV